MVGGLLELCSTGLELTRPRLTPYPTFWRYTPDAGQALALRGLCEFETGDYTHSLADIGKGLASEPPTMRTTSRSSVITKQCC